MGDVIPLKSASTLNDEQRRALEAWESVATQTVRTEPLKTISNSQLESVPVELGDSLGDIHAQLLSALNSGGDPTDQLAALDQFIDKLASRG